ncbi:MAG: MBL fold metallo-hydrolase [Candidatus Thorarchaeota archaeon]|jgi:7,8-dihydropterin-6-yl-methyl-4-(beta-D-ribofuranosyl)aminobenzene 5'-phosphate synthase
MKKRYHRANGTLRVVFCMLIILSLSTGCMDDTTPDDAGIQAQEAEPPPSRGPSPPGCDFQEDVPPISASDVSITVIYDNNVYDSTLQPDWGFSCLVKGCEKTILFDTGTHGSILLKNMEKLQITPEEIDVVILSHVHQDHTGGLETILRRKSALPVYVLQSFPFAFKEQARESGAEVIAVEDPVRICSHVYSTGELGGYIQEQSLIIRTDRGLVVITGCAHPGIIRIIQETGDLVQSDLYLVMGGFHLQGTEQSWLEEIISDFKTLGVQYAGPCHCSGDMARGLFEAAYGQYYISIGVGKVINLGALD